MRRGRAVLAVVVAVVAVLGGAVAARAQGREPPAPSTTPGLYRDSWAVVVGINRFKGGRIARLNYAVNDARSVARALVPLGFPEKNITVLLDEQATRADVERVLSSVIRRATGPDDRLVVFFATHGVTAPLPHGGEEGYLLLHDSDPDDLPLTALAMQQLKHIGQRIPAKHILVAVDACYGGYSLVRSPSPPALDRRYLELIGKSRVIHVMTAGKKDEAVVEDRGHGVFTRTLLDGLAGHADENRDGLVTVSELGAWMHPRVAQASDYRQDMQWGSLDGEGQLVFALPAALAAARLDPARARAEEERRRIEAERQLAEERRQLQRERERLEEERRRLEAEGGRGRPPQTAAVREPPLSMPPRGALLYALDLSPAGEALPRGMGNPQADRIRFLGDAVEFSVSTWSFAVIGLAGLTVADFVAEMRVRPVSGDGYVALQFHLGREGYHTVRVVPGTGTLAITLAPPGRHAVEDEKVLSGALARAPARAAGEEMVLTVVARGAEITVYADGREIARGSDATVGRGRVEFAVGTFTTPFVVRLTGLRVWGPAP